MLSTLSAHKNIIIGIVVLVLVFIGYGVYGPKSSAVTPDLARQNTTGTTGTAADPNSPGRLFVSQLLAIQNIHYNLDLFNDPAFKYLQDFSRELTPQNVGRQNPFAPLGSGLGTGSTGPFVTDTTAGFVNTSDETTTVGTSTRTTTPPGAAGTRIPASTATTTRR